ncbi:MAG: polyprenyl synthetase family protein [Chloroflexi bacterium]|nr:polyprenyl synthetase family protein [Chloroflexota bacterium]
MKLPAVFDRHRAEIDAEMRAALAERELPLYHMMRYHLGWADDRGNSVAGPAGKALRPTLCLAACEAAGAEYRRALPAAAAVELAHNYSLIHDDIQDDDRERRHRATVWSIWGKPQAINAGTAMRVLASLALSRLEQYNVPAQKQLRAQRLMDEASLRLLEGQYLDINYESRFDIGVSDYLSMIEGKTAALMACSLEMGALLATDDAHMISSFYDIGRNLGLAFQIKDDILGIWGSEQETGKLQGSDIRHRKKTLPIVYALEKADNGLKKELVSVYSNGMVERDGVVTVLATLEAVGAQSYAQRMAESYCDAAIKAMNGLELPSPAKNDLMEMARFLVQRDF